MSSRRKKFLLSFLLAVLLTVCAGTLWSLLNWYRLQRTPQVHPSDKLASTTGWKIYRSSGNKKVYQASVETFSIERARLGPFAIGPLQVARLQKVVIDFYAEGLLSDPGADGDPSKSDTFKIDTIEGPLADIRNDLLHRSRKIGILDIDGISLNLWQREKRIFGISSDRATIDRKTGDVIFIGHASLDAAENGSIISHRITWVRKTSLFRINDPFILAKADERKEGRELETDYLLKKVKYQIKS